MAAASDLEEIEGRCPWEAEDFRADLQRLRRSTAEAARAFAADMRVLAMLQAQVPRCPFDDRGATPWTSFRREVAVARTLSDRGADAEIRCARMLTQVLPRTMALLQAGDVTVQRARAFVSQVECYDDDLARLIDAELADRVPELPPWRIEQEARRTAARIDADAAALRVASRNAGRSVSLQPGSDDQATALIDGPAVALTRWYATLDARARELKAAGDPRTLNQLRFDLATSTFPCATHAPADATVAPPTAAAQSASATSDAPPTHGVAPEGGITELGVGASRDGTSYGSATEARTTTGGTEDRTTAGGATDDRTVAPGTDAPGTDATSAETTGPSTAGPRPSFVEPAHPDCRRSRPVQANITVPVETSLGLSNDPAWLDGYGWVSAPTARLLLVDAELRRVCVHARTGQLVDVAERDVRPPPTPVGLRESLLDMVLDPIVLTGSSPSCRREDQHDPSPPLREYVALRDRFCDGPTGTRASARRTDLDHDIPWPDGPTAAWNLAARAKRTHQLKHYGWTPLRTPTSTIWFSPAGQVVEVPRHQQAPPGVDAGDAGCGPPGLPAPAELAVLESAQLQPVGHDDSRPWLPAGERDTTTWHWYEDEPPF